jgi:hypothetical protein
VLDIHAADDILDEHNNPTAQKFASLMQTADEERRRKVLKTMKGIAKDSSKSADSAEITRRLAKARAGFGKAHHKTRNLAAPARSTKPAEPPKPTPVTPERQAVNMELAQSGSAFSVSTLSQLANRQPGMEQTGPNEVTISLH